VGALPVRRPKAARLAGLYAGLVLGGIAMVIPFLWMFSTSLKTRAEVFATAPFTFPTGLHWENYATMWSALPGVTFGTFFQNSIVISALATAGQVITCAMAAYAFAAFEFRGKRILFALILATLAIFQFMWSWNDLLDPLIYLRDLPSYTTTVGLAFFQGQYVGKWPEMMAGALVSLLPMIILFVVAQKYFVRGITLSGLKG